MKCSAVVIFALALAAPLFASSARAECLKYDTKATLTGKVVERTGHGKPGDDNAPVRYFVLLVDKPLCFDSDEDYPAEQNVISLQIWAGDAKYCTEHPGINCHAGFINEFSKKYNGKTVKVIGEVFHEILAWHRTKVLILPASINQLSF